MNLRRKRELLKVQMLETERMIALMDGHSIMTQAYTQKMNSLKGQLEALPMEERETKVVLYFTGGPVAGSVGIDASFVGKAILPFQKMINADLAQRGHGNVGQRGLLKNADDAKLFLTALPRGSFGIELSKLDGDHPCDELHVSDTIAHVVKLIDASSKSDEEFATFLNDISQRTLNGLRQFLKIISENKAGIKIETGGIRISLAVDDVFNAHSRVANTSTQQNEIELSGVLKGILLESWRFDFIDHQNKSITGSINTELTEEEVNNFVISFFNKECVASFLKTDVFLKNGRIKESYLLNSIRS